MDAIYCSFDILTDMILENRNVPTKSIRPESITVACLNMYSRIIGDDVYDYIVNHPEVYIWCLQEVNSSMVDVVSADNRHSSMLEKLRAYMPDYMSFHAPVLLYQPVDTPNFSSDYGTTILCRYGMPVVDYRQLQVSGHIHESLWTEETAVDHSRALQYVKLDWGDGSIPLTIYNYHGVWFKSEDGISFKDDNEERLKIAHRIRSLIDTSESDTVFCGDFNLDPDTKSLTILKGDLVDLITEYDIKTTRSSMYKKDSPFADYMFVSKSLTVEEFVVENVVISDHLPLVAKIRL